MRIRKVEGFWFSVGGAWFVIFFPKISDGSFWRIAVLFAGLVWVVWMIASYIAPDDSDYITIKTRKQKRRELRERRIRELEEEERQHRGGECFEPLDLEWPVPLLDEVRERQEKKRRKGGGS